MTLLKFSKYYKKLKPILYFTVGGLIGLWVILVAMGLSLVGIIGRYEGKVYPGVFAYGNPMAGKTVWQLEEFLAEKEKEVEAQKVIFFWKNPPDGGEKRYEFVPSMIEFQLDKSGMINELITVGRTENGMKNFLELYRLLIFPIEVKPSFKYSQEKLNQSVLPIETEVNRPVQDALFEFKGGKAVNFQVSKEGRMVDSKQVKSLIVLAFSQMEPAKLLALDLPVETVYPKITTAQTNSLGIKEKLAEGESFFKDSIPGRVHNIILAASYLHGVVIAPGEVFSFAKRIGDISAETGYKQAYVIREKKTVLEDGGGVCQVSTTMFRAALNAGLPVTERQAHYYRVGFYEQGGYPPGLDATVYPPSPDLKFKNDTNTYILIQTIVDQPNKRLAFELYGTSDGRRVEMQKPVIHSQTPPPEPIYVDEPSLKAGVVKRLDTAHWGAKVSFLWKVFNTDGSIKESREFWSNYVPWPAVYQRGTGQ
jgi:vancomycin resistance protein YoaR